MPYATDMDKKEKLKLCPYCDGRVVIEACECPFCGEEFGEGLTQERPRSRRLDESLVSSYEPPYVAKSRTKAGVPNQTPRREEPVKLVEEEKEDTQESKKSFISLLLLSVGANLFTLGWLLFFFSERGKLTLEWKSRYWPVYVLCSLAPLYYGFRSLKNK
ncbi:MAG: hypothetical protein FJZ56_00100 [Chlamydiae bacterium]|nr:hypothetical protein [Chlamydiota bacterium]